MSKLSIEKEILIEASIEKVYEIIGDFHSWQHWSPWLICEPKAQVKINNTGDFYSWEGNRVGSGQMKILKKTPTKIDYDLTFIKPWKSQADVSFTLIEKDGKTLAKWSMESKWPFYLFFMRKKMEVLVGMDYDRGLKMLKEYVEDGRIYSYLDFMGNQKYEGCKYMGIKTKATMSTMGDKMKQDFGTLSAFAKDNGIEMSGQPFAQYHKFDFVSGEIEYTAGFPVKEKPSNLSDALFYGNMDAFTMNVVRHKGKYDHMGNAWSAQVMMTRNKEFKQSKKIHPFELYQNSPMDTPHEELITDICFPLK